MSERLPGLHPLHLYWFRTRMTEGGKCFDFSSYCLESPSPASQLSRPCHSAGHKLDQLYRSQLDVASASIGPLITGAFQSIRLLTGLITTLITLVTMRPTIVDIPGGGTTTGPDADANLQQLRPVPIMHFCEHASSLAPDQPILACQRLQHL